MTINQNRRSFSVYLLMILTMLCTGLTLSDRATAQENAEVERLGNPFAERYADPSMFYARNIWTMQVFDGRIYFGGGNSSNNAPAGNAGPVDIWAYDPQAAQFNREFTVEEEQIDRYAVYDGMLYVPGHDEMDGVNTGNIYRLEAEGWKQYRTVPNSVHVYDLHEYDGRLFGSIGNALEDNAVVVVSDDGGMSWTSIPVNLNLDPADPARVARGWSLFEIGDELYLNAFSTFAAVLRENGVIDILRELPTVFRYEGDHFEPVAEYLFPGAPDGFLRRVPRDVQFHDQTVYIGAEGVNDHQWEPFGLYVADSALQIQRLLEDRSVSFWDVLVDGETLYVLTSEPANDGGQTISVLATDDLESWEPVVTFEAETFARSFARLEGVFYFGLGCETEAPTAACGEVLRIAR